MGSELAAYLSRAHPRDDFSVSTVDLPYIITIAEPDREH
jgi:hypothetical protein